MNSEKRYALIGRKYYDHDRDTFVLALGIQDTSMIPAYAIEICKEPGQVVMEFPESELRMSLETFESVFANNFPNAQFQKGLDLLKDRIFQNGTDVRNEVVLVDCGRT